jgi:hypothetical protein
VSVLIEEPVFVVVEFQPASNCELWAESLEERIHSGISGLCKLLKPEVQTLTHRKSRLLVAGHGWMLHRRQRRDGERAATAFECSGGLAIGHHSGSWIPRIVVGSGGQEEDEEGCRSTNCPRSCRRRRR